MAGSFVEELKSALEEHIAYDDNPKDPCNTPTYVQAKLPCRLRCIVLQPGFMPPSSRPGVAGSAVQKNSWMMTRLKDIEEAAKRRQNVLVTLKARMQDPDKVPFKPLKNRQVKTRTIYTALCEPFSSTGL
ncbi:hypothetical protein HHX47_DHR5000732 [Lentinula edodes]|nr:hypothetical protein HHX47_DHR5000732 [Lentinula edodes]